MRKPQKKSQHTKDSDASQGLDAQPRPDPMASFTVSQGNTDVVLSADAEKTAPQTQHSFLQKMQ